MGLGPGDQHPAPFQVGAGEMKRGLELFVDGLGLDEVRLGGVAAPEPRGEHAQIMGDGAIPVDDLVGPGRELRVERLGGRSITEPGCCR